MAMANDSINFIKSSAMSDIFTVLFTFFNTLQIGDCKSDPIVK